MSDARAGEGGPFEEQRRIYGLLSQETRHLVLQFVLGHPSHLPSLDELAYMIPKNKAAIRDQLQVLCEEGLVERYDYPPNEDSRDLPSQFYGLTEYGVEVLAEYNYLRGLPIARAIYDNTRLSERSQRHRDAPRPDLPEFVDRALRIDESESSANFERLERYIRERKDHAPSVDEQVEVARRFYDAGIDPDHEGIKRADVVDQLDVNLEFSPVTVLSNLVAIDVLEETIPSGPDVFAISERLDEIVNGQVTEEAKKNVEALVTHIDDELHSAELNEDAAEMAEESLQTPSIAVTDGAGRTIRSILATKFDIPPERVVDFLRSGDPVSRLNEAVEAIESAEELSKSEDYGQIVFVSQAYRYRLTNRAMELLAE